MAFRGIFGFFLAFSLVTTPLADPLELNPSRPEQYTVVEGDTLWEIAGRFLRDPWEWPKIWNSNPQIHNPDLIYPGDVIALSYVDGVPRLNLLRKGYTSGYGSGRDIKLSPQVRITPLEEAIPVIPVDAISPFLTSPKVVSDNELANAAYVIDFAGEHILAGTDDRIYVRSITSDEIGAFTVFRPGSTYIDPETNEILGYEAAYVADAQLQRIGDPATLRLTKSTQETRRGDRLMPNTQEEVNLNYRPHAPEAVISGHIISVMGGVSEIGQYDIVVVDRGTRNGVATGHVFDIFHAGRVINDPISSKPNDMVKLPDEEAGRLMVFRAFEKVSYALVMDAAQAIHVNDNVQTP
ncbi:MAG: LysM peptidoglycan-binding domain-containing protein [Pseudomonadota bacterium]